MLGRILGCSLLFASLWAQYPDNWSINVHNYEHTMTVTSTVLINGVPDLHGADRLAAFAGESCRGLANPILVGETPLYFLIVYGDLDTTTLDFFVWDSFTESVIPLNEGCQFEGGGAVGTVSQPFIFTGINPVTYVLAVNDSVTQLEDEALAAPIRVLDNDVVYSEVFIQDVTTVVPPQHGTVSQSGEAHYYYYESDENFFGLDSFQYALQTLYGTDSAWVQVTVLPVNDPPSAFNLLGPADNSFLQDAAETEVEFAWSLPVDVEGDLISYTLAFLQAGAVDSSIACSSNSTIVNIENLPRDIWLDWYVMAFDAWDWVSSTDTFALKISGTVNLAEAFSLPTTFNVGQNYPNPFNPSTTLKYGLPERETVQIVIYDVAGRTVRSAVLESQPAGWHSYLWDGRLGSGEPASSGLYLCRLQGGRASQVVKMLLIR